MSKNKYIPEKPLILLGFMGSGKSTLAKILSAKLSLPCIDTDLEIEKRLDKKIVDIFTENGEDFFRNYENRLLVELLQKNNVQIIAIGGGTPCYFNAMELINKKSLSVYLQLPYNVVKLRLKKNNNPRPLMQKLTESELETLFLQREKTYLQAQFIVNANQLPEATADEIISKITTHKIDCA